MFNEKPYKFGKKSASELLTCHPDIQMIMNDVIQYRDFSILCGYRNEIDQNKAFAEGKSKVKFPNGKHNKQPSLAVDITPYPIEWKDARRFGDLVRFIQGYALAKYNIKLRVGMDFNGDFEYNDNFYDYPHLELHSRLVDGKWIKYE